MLNFQEEIMGTQNTKIQDVLFQKIGQTWFIFSEIDGELIYSTMPEGMDPRSTKLELYQVIEEHLSRVAGKNISYRGAEVA